MILVEHNHAVRIRFREDLHFVKYDSFHLALANAPKTAFFVSQMVDTSKSYFMCLFRSNAALLENPCGDFKLYRSILSAMRFLLLEHYDSLFSDESSHLRRLECLNKVICFLNRMTRISWSDVQKKEYKKRFENIQPQILKGYDSIWMQIFEYYYSAEAEYLIICESCFTVLSLLTGYKMRDKNETGDSQISNSSNHGGMSGIDIGYCIRLLSSVLLGILHNIEAACWGAIVIQQFIISFSHGQHRELTMNASESLYLAIKYHDNNRYLVTCILNQLSYDIVRFGIPDFKVTSASEILVRVLKIHLDDKNICENIVRIFNTWAMLGDNSENSYNNNNNDIRNDDDNNDNNNNDSSNNNNNNNSNNNDSNSNNYNNSNNNSNDNNNNNNNDNNNNSIEQLFQQDKTFVFPIF